jgi:hypothetical protein
VHFIIVIQLLIFGPLGIAFCVLDIFLLCSVVVHFYIFEVFRFRFWKQ